MAVTWGHEMESEIGWSIDTGVTLAELDHGGSRDGLGFLLTLTCSASSRRVLINHALLLPLAQQRKSVKGYFILDLEFQKQNSLYTAIDLLVIVVCVLSSAFVIALPFVDCKVDLQSNLAFSIVTHHDL